MHTNGIATLPDELLAALTSALEPAPKRAAECMTCSHLEMRVEPHAGTRRVFWCRCSKGHALVEGRNFGERVLLAPPECDTAQDFQQWEPGAR